ncbi:hypothetical protein ACJJTC_013375 [Scirpophaga incertulas]
MQFLPLSRWTRDAYDVTVTVREQSTERQQRAQSDNLRKVDSFMVFDYLSNHCKFTSAEIRGWKLQSFIGAARSHLPQKKKCYWAKPKLATIGTTTKFIKAKDMGPSSVTTEDNNTDKTNGDQFFQAVVQSLKENSVRNQLSVYITKRKAII